MFLGILMLDSQESIHGGEYAVKILRLGHYALKVADIERSTRFYRDVMGLDERERGPQGEVYLLRGPGWSF